MANGGMPEATSNVIALSNLHLQTTRMEVAQEVHKIFRPGNIFLIRWPPVAPPLDNTQHNGICVIEYHNMEAAQRAIHAFCGAGLSLRGQRVKVGPAKLVPFVKHPPESQENYQRENASPFPAAQLPASQSPGPSFPPYHNEQSSQNNTIIPDGWYPAAAELPECIDPMLLDLSSIQNRDLNHNNNNNNFAPASQEPVPSFPIAPEYNTTTTTTTDRKGKGKAIDTPTPSPQPQALEWAALQQYHLQTDAEPAAGTSTRAGAHPPPTPPAAAEHPFPVPAPAPAPEFNDVPIAPPLVMMEAFTVGPEGVCMDGAHYVPVLSALSSVPVGAELMVDTRMLPFEYLGPHLAQLRQLEFRQQQEVQQLQQLQQQQQQQQSPMQEFLDVPELEDGAGPGPSTAAGGRQASAAPAAPFGHYGGQLHLLL